jgi:purine-binding chemotaxis protein CheW
MSTLTPSLADRVAELRDSFDRAFAEPATSAVAERLDLIVVQVGDERFAMRVADIAGLHADVAVTPCPGPLRELVGIVGFRGAVLPLYDLGLLLGVPGAAGRWLVLTADNEAALSFTAFGGHLRVPPDAVAVRQDKAARHVGEVVRSNDGSLPLIDLSSVLATIRTRAAAARKED